MNIASLLKSFNWMIIVIDTEYRDYRKLKKRLKLK